MTAYSDLESAVAAFQGGAFEYLPKPFDVDHAVELVRRALGENRRQGEENSAPGEGKPQILGQAPAMQEGFRATARCPRTHAPRVLTTDSQNGARLTAPP